MQDLLEATLFAFKMLCQLQRREAVGVPHILTAAEEEEGFNDTRSILKHGFKQRMTHCGLDVDFVHMKEIVVVEEAARNPLALTLAHGGGGEEFLLAASVPFVARTVLTARTARIQVRTGRTTGHVPCRRWHLRKMNLARLEACSR
mmetsp:Transcript_69543/g.165871  ORF Transcript_69543/g.165871 Transcript_69543/m.165871 type:complete len:146 (+) Transcript_69543:335-772(+)